ncbi:MAG: HEPN domain-containing protein [Lachnospiraceae bacterium]
MTEPKTEDGKILIMHPYKDAYWEHIMVDKNGVARGETEEAKSTVEILCLNRPELIAYRNNNIAAFIQNANNGENVYEVYRNSITYVKKLLLSNIEEKEIEGYFYRLVYANIIASMEAYLSKTIISLVLNDEDLFWTFVQRFDWGKEKVNISEVKDVYGKMNIKVQKALAEVLYHNLSKVKQMYRCILEINVLDEDDEMEFLCKAVEIRHDIVHRNGRKNIKKQDVTSVDEYHNIELEQIEELIKHVDELVDSIERQIN